MNLESISKDVLASLGAQSVFGSPVQLGNHTIVPVSAMLATVAGGEGKSALGGGQGGSVVARYVPVGFLWDGPQGVEFVAIDLPENASSGRPRHLSDQGSGTPALRELAHALRARLTAPKP
jgi:hypothetical protein